MTLMCALWHQAGTAFAWKAFLPGTLNNEITVTVVAGGVVMLNAIRVLVTGIASVSWYGRY